MAIEKNQKVTMHYELRISEDLVESNMDKDPINFEYGQGQIIPGLEAGIAQMNEGETKVINVSAKEAYGEYDEELSQIVPIGEFEGINLEIGMVLEAVNEKEEVLKATVTEVTNDDVTVDYNHPLAGCDLEFTVLVKKID